MREAAAMLHAPRPPAAKALLADTRIPPKGAALVHVTRVGGRHGPYNLFPHKNGLEKRYPKASHPGAAGPPSLARPGSPDPTASRTPPPTSTTSAPGRCAKDSRCAAVMTTRGGGPLRPRPQKGAVHAGPCSASGGRGARAHPAACGAVHR